MSTAHGRDKTAVSLRERLRCQKRMHAAHDKNCRCHRYPGSRPLPLSTNASIHAKEGPEVVGEAKQKAIYSRAWQDACSSRGAAV